ncbi:MAG: hypothetical protein SOR40_03770 [Rothia sp. (in: high G+C Gram-positive bacteria)]|nr:hypothetical protein [Rothia sp. (in: high G+C Gram-positive bacteria)]
MKKLMNQAYLAALFASLLGPEEERERGDVPGWVMVTMMTALLVAAILVVAQDALITMFNNAMSTLNR